MLRYGYDRSLATGVITASGTLAQIIPPSLVLIVLADQLGASVGDMYAGALLPGLLLVLLYCLYVFGVTVMRPAAAPALPPEARTLGKGGGQVLVLLLLGIVLGVVSWYLLHGRVTRGEEVYASAIAALVVYLITYFDKTLGLNRLNRLTQQVVFVLMPPLALIFLVLGTIFISLATPTEGGAMGALGALLLSMAKRRLSLASLSEALDATTKLSCFVLFILVGSRVFSLTFYGVEGHKWVEHLFLNLPGGEWGFLIAVNILVFVLGCFIDFFEIAFIVIPLLAPVAKALGIDLVWFGVIIGMNMQTSFLTPPFGFALFYMRSVAPIKNYIDKLTGKTIAGVPTTQIYRGAINFIIIQLIMVAVVMAFPRLVVPEKAAEIDTKNIQIELPPLGGDTGATPGQPDLSQPPSFE
jgi:TRAP-type mannitol/chloroaromatic compound transport system permease large subunit